MTTAIATTKPTGQLQTRSSPPDLSSKLSVLVDQPQRDPMVMALPTKAEAEAIQGWLVRTECWLADERSTLDADASDQAINRKLTALATALPPRQNQTAEEARTMLAIYVKGLSDLPEAAIDEACNTAVRTSKWFPKVAELREWAKVKYPPEFNAATAKVMRAKEVMKAVELCGHADKEVMSADELAAFKAEARIDLDNAA